MEASISGQQFFRKPRALPFRLGRWRLSGGTIVFSVFFHALIIGAMLLAEWLAPAEPLSKVVHVRMVDLPELRPPVDPLRSERPVRSQTDTIPSVKPGVNPTKELSRQVTRKARVKAPASAPVAAPEPRLRREAVEAKSPPPRESKPDLQLLPRERLTEPRPERPARNAPPVVASAAKPTPQPASRRSIPSNDANQRPPTAPSTATRRRAKPVRPLAMPPLFPKVAAPSRPTQQKAAAPKQLAKLSPASTPRTTTAAKPKPPVAQPKIAKRTTERTKLAKSKTSKERDAVDQRSTSQAQKKSTRTTKLAKKLKAARKPIPPKPLAKKPPHDERIARSAPPSIPEAVKESSLQASFRQSAPPPSQREERDAGQVVGPKPSRSGPKRTRSSRPLVYGLVPKEFRLPSSGGTARPSGDGGRPRDERRAAYDAGRKSASIPDLSSSNLDWSASSSDGDSSGNSDSSGFGGSATRIPINTQDVRYMSYARSVCERIRSVWHDKWIIVHRRPGHVPPPTAQTFYLMMEFSIKRNGRLAGYRVLRQSHYEILDRVAIASVQEAAPYNPLPRRIKDDQLVFGMGFSYSSPGPRIPSNFENQFQSSCGRTARAPS